MKKYRFFRIVVVTLLVLLSIFVGFLFAGIGGAMLFGFFNTISWIILKHRTCAKTSFRFIPMLIALTMISYILMSVFGLLGAKEIVNEKVSMLKEELQKDGYNPRWFIISQKRHPLFNEILKNSVKNSKHLTGNAIDLFIIDINDDGMYNQTDFTIMKNVSHECDKVNPSVRGNLYNYLDRGFLSCNMVHLEVE